MLLDVDDRRAMLDAVGDVAVLDGGLAVAAQFLSKTKEIDGAGGIIWTDAPRLTVAVEDAGLIVLNSTEITVGGATYQAYDKEPPAGGFIHYYLTRDY